MLKGLKGLYYFLKNSRVIPIPKSLDHWKLFWSVCCSWSEGVPLDVQFGSDLAFSDSLNPETYNIAMELITYTEKRTDKNLALFQMYPIEERIIIHHRQDEPGVIDPLNRLETLGWKKSYAWEPL